MLYDELDEVRYEFEVLRAMMDAALDTRAQRSTLTAIAATLRDRRDRLERLERMAKRLHEAS